MKTARAAFLVGLEQIESFLERWNREQALVALLNARRETLAQDIQMPLQVILDTSTNAKQYVYAVTIVSLYGLIERLVDSLVSRFVMSLAEFGQPYEQLPGVIKDRHLPKSLDLADAIVKETFYGELTANKLIANLHSCLGGSDPFTLNGDAFAFHRGNVSLSKIQEMLSGVGVTTLLRRLSLTPTFVEFLGNINPERDVRSIPDGDLQALFEPIDDLVERRNGISHGMLEADEIESMDMLRSRLGFTRAFGIGLFELLRQDLLKYAADVGVALPLGQPIVVYNHSIVCFEAECGIAIGDEIFAVIADGGEPVRAGKILALQVDHVAQEAIAAGQRVQFGAEVDFRANDGHNYFLLRGLDR